MAASKTIEIYRVLRKRIIEFKYNIDEPINEKTVAEEFGVSKTPAREALVMLVQDGYLKNLPRQGYFINEVSESEYYKLLYLRFTLEKGVVSNIIANCSDEEIDSLYRYCEDTDVTHFEFGMVNRDFHVAMAKLTGNDFLTDAVRTTLERTLRLPSKTLYNQFRKDPHAHHKLIIESLKSRDVEKVHALLRDECRRDDDIDLWF